VSELLINPTTEQQLANFVAAPSHAVILHGPTGAGKFTLALQLAADLLQTNRDSLQSHAYVLVLRENLGIEAVRELEHFLSLKVPSQAAVHRAIIVEDAHRLSVEAQNALLKTLEEPPVGTVLILTTNSLQALLPTIRSRTQSIAVKLPDRTETEAYFGSQSQQAYAMSGGLPGLMSALLSDEEHPLLLATAKARALLAQTSYERLLQVDSLAKDKILAQNVMFILQQMAHVSLQKAEGPAATSWRQVLSAAYSCSENLAQSGQPKLALTNLMLNL